MGVYQCTRLQVLHASSSVHVPSLSFGPKVGWTIRPHTIHTPLSCSDLHGLFLISSFGRWRCLRLVFISWVFGHIKGILLLFINWLCKELPGHNAKIWSIYHLAVYHDWSYWRILHSVQHPTFAQWYHLWVHSCQWWVFPRLNFSPLHILEAELSRARAEFAGLPDVSKPTLARLVISSSSRDVSFAVLVICGLTFAFAIRYSVIVLDCGCGRCQRWLDGFAEGSAVAVGKMSLLQTW